MNPEPDMSPRMIATLLETDLRKLARDPVLLVAALLPAILALVLRLSLPAIELALANLSVPFELSPHLPTIVAGALTVSVMMAGWIVGFFLLEDREQNMLTVLGVTPLTRRGFLLWRLTLPIVISTIGSMVVLGCDGVSMLDPARAVVAALLLSLAAPGFALALVAFADNEVEGLAISKFGGLVFMLPLLSLYLDGAWQWLFVLLPTYWPVQLLAGGPWWLLGPGVIAAALWLGACLRRFSARAD